jgi:multidrug efflux pump subunit AcrB
MQNTSEEVRGMLAVYETLSKSPLSDKAFGFSEAYIYFSMDEIIADVMWRTLAFGGMAVGVIGLAFLGNLQATGVVIAMVFSVDICILGSMYWWKVQVNAISAICIVMAVGLVIDYLVHPIHYFMLQANDLTAEERLKRCMAEIFTTVFFGVSTTFIGILPLAFAQSYIFRVFFYMFFDIILFSAMHSFILTPTLMLLLNPKAARASEEAYLESEEAAGQIGERPNRPSRQG